MISKEDFYKLRKNLGLTQKEMAIQLGFKHGSVISDFEVWGYASKTLKERLRNLNKQQNL